MGRTRGSNQEADTNGLVLVDVTRPATGSVSHGSIGMWRIGSDRVKSCRRCSNSHGSGGVGPRCFYISRIGSGQEVIKGRGEVFQSYRPGRVGSGGFLTLAGPDPTLPVKFDLTRKQPLDFPSILSTKVGTTVKYRYTCMQAT